MSGQCLMGQNGLLCTVEDWLHLVILQNDIVCILWCSYLVPAPHIGNFVFLGDNDVTWRNGLTLNYLTT